MIATFTRHVDHLGRSAGLRRFLVNFLVQGRSTLAQRRISAANSGYFRRFATTCDAILEVLRQPGWEPLDAKAEEGILRIPRVADWPDRPDPRAWVDAMDRERDRWFRGACLFLSRLAPRDGYTLRDWPAPRRILLAMGPNIGIGDEIICFRVARRLQMRYPEARLEALSFYPSLWDLCPGVTVRECAAQDPLLPFVRACELLREDPEALVVFVDFASLMVARSLETVPGLSRFLYVDPATPALRLVDSAAGWISEYRMKSPRRLYRCLGRLLDEVVGRDLGCHDGHEPPLLREAGPERAVPRVYVNPFTSKEYDLITAQWWIDALNSVGAPMEVRIFAGVNEVTRQCAREIAAGLTHPEVSLHGEHEVVPIAETLREAAESDLVFGLDTFTCHVGVLARVPCVTVYLNYHYHYFWYVPDNAVLAAFAWDDAETAGRMVARLLQPEPTASYEALAAAASEVRRAGSLEERGAAAGALLAALEPLQDEFADLAPGMVEDLRGYLASLGAGLARAKADEALGHRLDMLLTSNVVRYAEFLAARRVPVA